MTFDRCQTWFNLHFWRLRAVNVKHNFCFWELSKSIQYNFWRLPAVNVDLLLIFDINVRAVKLNSLLICVIWELSLLIQSFSLYFRRLTVVKLDPLQIWSLNSCQTWVTPNICPSQFASYFWRFRASKLVSIIIFDV